MTTYFDRPRLKLQMMDETHWKEILSHISHSPPDITLVGSNGSISAHQLVLAAASPFVHEIIQSLQEPMLIIPDVDVSCLVHFKSLLYQGEVKTGSIEEIHQISYVIELLKIPIANMGVTFPENAIPQVTFVEPGVIENINIEILGENMNMDVSETAMQPDDIPVSDNVTSDFESCMLESAEIVTDESMILDIEEDLGRLLDLAEQPVTSSIERSEVEVTEYKSKCDASNDLILPVKCAVNDAIISSELHLKSTVVSAMLSPSHDKKLDEIDQLLQEKLSQTGSPQSSIESRSPKPVVLENKSKFHRQCICEFCGAIVTKNNLKQHMAIHDPNKLKKFECVVCKKRYLTKKDLGEHYAETHYTGTGPFQCQICNSTVKKNIQRHLRDHALQKQYNCNHCTESFPKQYLLKNHLNFKHNEGTLNQCTTCLKIFSSNSNLIRHLETHKEDRKTIDCFLCSSTFTSKEALSFHLQAHADYKPHVCTICSKSFVKKDKLQKHMKSHVIKYNCEYCKLPFKHKAMLRLHEDACRIGQVAEV